MPDYDGRGSQGPTTGEVLLWVPRIILFPVYVATEFLIRRPFGAVVAGSERAGLLRDTASVPSPERGRFHVAPLAVFDLGFQTRVGAEVEFRDVLSRGNDLRAKAGFGGFDWLLGAVGSRSRLNTKDTIDLEISGYTRADHAYFGTGARSRESHRSRFGSDGADATISVDLLPRSGVRLRAWTGLRARAFFDSAYGGDPALSVAAPRSLTPYPDSLLEGYTAVHSGVGLTFDSRATGRPGNGVRFEVHGEEGSAPDPNRSWVRYGGRLTGFLDLHHQSRILSLSIASQFADPLTRLPAPFTELVTLGGNDLMTGFLPGRLIGRSDACATLGYRWPIWAMLNGVLETAIGNVFGPHLEDFKPSLLRFSGTVAIEAKEPSPRSLKIAFGLGTETFESGGKLDSVRLTVGMPHGL